MWYEEMINNRNKSVVRDMKWTADGRKIAIVYEDGAVIVGSVDGNRLWGKDLPYPLRFVEWSPDGKLLLFVTFEAEIYIYDADGNKLRQFPILGQDPNALGGDCMITSIHWYCPSNLSYYSSSKSANSNSTEPLPATLCIAFENGKIQLTRGDDESTSELIDTDLSCVDYIRWSTKGNILAVVGTQRTGGNNANISMSMKTENVKNTNIVKFFDANGRFIRNLKIPGENIREVSWEGGDLRLSLAVDAFIYFANIRHKYTWTYFLNTVVYAYNRSERKDFSVVFWDLTTQEVYTKIISNVKFLISGGDVCAIVISERPSSANSIVTKSALKKEDSNKDSEDKNPTPKVTTGTPTEVYSIQLRNSIGAVLDTKAIPFAPKYIAMSAYTIVIANDRTVYTWQYQSMSSRFGGSNTEDDDTNNNNNNAGSGRNKSSSINSGNVNKQRIFDIQNINFTYAQSPETFTISNESIIDPITSVTISDKYLIVGRKNGLINRFNLPHLTPENTYHLYDHEPITMQLNCYSNKLAVVDANGIFNLLDLDFRVPEVTQAEGKEDTDFAPPKSSKNTPSSSNPGGSNSVYLGTHFGKKLPIERKDVWDVCWAEDDPDMIVIMEKTKMVVFHGEVSEEPVVSAAYLARVKDLEIRVFALDTLMQHPDKISKEYVIDFESKLLRELREKIATVGLVNAYEYAEMNASHKRLWKLLGQVALEEMEFTIAEKSFIRCEDYYSIMFVKQVMTMTDKMKARAEIAIYLAHFDEAEGLYREIDRKDLAIALRKSLGDYPRVIQLLQTGGGNDKLIQTAYNSIADYYYDRRKWKKAIQYYLLSHNMEKLIHCYYYLELFPDLVKMMSDLPDDSPLLMLLGQKFESVGMITEAMQCYLRSLNTMSPKEAIDCCVKLNKWDMALELAEKHDYPQVESLLMKFMIDLLNKNKKLEAIELFRVANKPTEAAILIGDLAETVISEMANPSLAKKLHVLAALEIERHRKRAIELAQQQDGTGAGSLTAGGTAANVAQATAATLETLMMTSLLEGGGTMNPNTLGGTLQLTLNTLHQGTTTTMNAKKVSRAFANAWRGAAAYHYYMLALKQFYAG
jgi:WD repeat-containing protein 35